MENVEVIVTRGMTTVPIQCLLLHNLFLTVLIIFQQSLCNMVCMYKNCNSNVLREKETSQHESERIFEVTFESGQPPSANCAIHSAVIWAQSHLHGLNGLETSLFLRSRNEFSLSRANSKNARLWRVDDSGEMVDSEHTKVRDCESTTLWPQR